MPIPTPIIEIQIMVFAKNLTNILYIIETRIQVNNEYKIGFFRSVIELK